MAEAKAQGCDSVITIGGIQSNHCRATSTAARELGMQPHLILRNNDTYVDKDPGMVGNLLVERLQGAQIYQVRSCRGCAAPICEAHWLGPLRVGAMVELIEVLVPWLSSLK